MQDITVFAEFADQPPLPVRRLHNYLYCPRLFYYQWVENIFLDNADTVEGKRTHRNVDASSRVRNPSDLDLPEGARLRSLKLQSTVLGLVGVVDLVEDLGDGPQIVDYKKGSAKRDENGERCAKEADAFQVIAYALLLREIDILVEYGWIYYAEDRRRVPVLVDESALDLCREKIAEAKQLAASGKCPPPLKDDPRCLYCSAYPICLPNESYWWARMRKTMEPEPQMHFPFVEEDVENSSNVGRIINAVEFSDAEPKLLNLEPPRPDRGDGEVLIVQTPGTQVGIEGGQLVVSKRRKTLSKLPAHQVRAVYLYGAVQLTAQAISKCLEIGIDVAWFSPAGRYIGTLHGLSSSGTDARRGQYRLFELSNIRIVLAREIIATKIRNQRVMLMRNGDAPKRALKLLSGFHRDAYRANNVMELLGIEGAAAAIYFEYFPTMLKGEKNWRFDWKGRNRRPPRDPVNALLSLGYSMLAKELSGVCHAVGLDPFLGFMHQPRYGRPALALDLMEEFRPLLPDSVAISLINRREIGVEDFLNSADGTFLNQNGRKAFWECWFRRMDTEVKHPEFGYSMAYRRMLEVQARQLWRFVRGEVSTYHGFFTR